MIPPINSTWAYVWQCRDRGSLHSGVLDYLFKTLKLWQNRKDANKVANANDPAYPNTPDHDVVIDVITGSSW